MKFECDRQALSRAVGAAIRGVNAKASVDFLRGLLLRCTGDAVTITGTDTGMGITATLEANVITPGAVVLDAHILSDIIKRASGSDVAISADDKLQTVICSGDAEFSIAGLSAQDYPALPEVEGLRTLTLSQTTLKKQIGKTIFSASDQETKAIHTGVLFDVAPESLTLVALDGVRLALRREAVEADEEYSFVVPAASLRELERMLEEDEEATVSLHIGDRHMLAELPGVTLVSRLLEGKFLAYKNAIPPTREFTYKMDTKAMRGALERVSLIITEKQKSPVRILFSDGQAQVSCTTAIGRAVDVVSYEGGGDIEIGFNPRFLLDALRRADGDTFRFEAAGPLAPCLILPDDGEDTVFMVLPVRLKGGA